MFTLFLWNWMDLDLQNCFWFNVARLFQSCHWILRNFRIHLNNIFRTFKLFKDSKQILSLNFCCWLFLLFDRNRMNLDLENCFCIAKSPWLAIFGSLPRKYFLCFPAKFSRIYPSSFHVLQAVFSLANRICFICSYSVFHSQILYKWNIYFRCE